VERRAALLDATLASILDAIIVCDREGRALFANPAAVRDAGLDPVGLEPGVALSRLTFARLDGSPVPIEDAPGNRALRGERVERERVRCRNALGEEMILETSAMPLRLDGRPAGAVVVWRDVTERERLVELLQRHAADLEDLTRAISHDLRTPLAAVLVQAQAIARDPARPEAVARRAGSIATGAKRMAAMLADLADLTRLEAGTPALELRPVDLRAFAAELRSRLAGALDASRIRLEIPADLGPVHADADRLERVLVNLVGNALKFSPPDRPVTVTAAPADGGVAIAIADEGPGIDPEDLPRIFERFYRSRRSAGVEGLGLGLHIAEKLVAAHGGRIEVDSVPGRGSTFRVILPASP
jgi:PAS domain S-box-containing protein